MVDTGNISFMLGKIEAKLEGNDKKLDEIKESLHKKASKEDLEAALKRIKRLESAAKILEEDAEIKKKDKKRLAWLVENGQNILLWIVVALLILDNTNLHFSLHQLMWH